ncbi:MAG TPA: hypothetical protein VGM03_08135 [Phycisphaerae bacterium]|jgi:hypothetical protein
MKSLNWGMVASCAAGLAMLSEGCRDRAPSGRYETNLGSAAAPLLPTGQYTYDAKILDGRAKKVERVALPRTEPSKLEAPASGAEGGSTGRAAGGAALSETDESAIRGVIARFAQIAKEGRYEALGDLFVPNQRAGAREALGTMTKMLERFDKLAAAMDKRAPGSKAQMDMMIGMSKTAIGTMLTPDLQSITAVGPDEAIAKLKAGPGNREWGLRRVDGLWCIDRPELTERGNQGKEAVDAFLRELDQLIADVESGAVPIPEIQGKLMGLAQKMQSVIPQEDGKK